MKTAITYAFHISRDKIHERDEKRQWRKTYDPSYKPRKSMLADSFRTRRQSMGRALSMFGRPQPLAPLPELPKYEAREFPEDVKRRESRAFGALER